MWISHLGSPFPSPSLYILNLHVFSNVKHCYYITGRHCWLSTLQNLPFVNDSYKEAPEIEIKKDQPTKSILTCLFLLLFIIFILFVKDVLISLIYWEYREHTVHFNVMYVHFRNWLAYLEWKIDTEWWHTNQINSCWKIFLLVSIHSIMTKYRLKNKKVYF